MKTTCPDCGSQFILPTGDVWWLADAKRRNPALKIICPSCGRRELARLDAERTRRKTGKEP